MEHEIADDGLHKNWDAPVWRECITMVLYVSIVLLATLAALPSGDSGAAAVHDDDGVHGLALGGLIWGTTVGLAMAHWFAFHMTALGFGRGKASREDLKGGVAQLAGAAFVALLATIPLLVFDDDLDVQASTFVPAVLIGLAGYLAYRAAGRSRAQALARGAVVLTIGLAVASMKNILGGH